MGMISFVRDAGERLFKPPFPQAGAAQPVPGTTSSADLGTLNKTASAALEKLIAAKGLPADKVEVNFDGSTSTVTITGNVPDQATREKIILVAGNVSGVERVHDKMTVSTHGESAQFYTVKNGDTLSTIAREIYGSPNKYSAIFEANRPMLSDPDEIQPGQSLRIPRLS